MAPKILMIDDEVKLVEAMREVFRSEGYDPISSTNSQEFLDIISKPQRIDVIVLDLDMPQINGVEIIKELKRNLSFKKIPIIVYSGAFNLGNQDLFFDAIEQRPYKVIHKGDLDTLLAAIKTALQERAQQQVLTEQERDELYTLETVYRESDRSLKDPKYLRYLELFNKNSGDNVLAEDYRKQREKLKKD